MKKSKSELVTIYRAAGEPEAYIIKAILEENGIPCFLSTGVPSMIVGMGLGQVDVIIEKARAEEARELIKEQDQNGV